jgi:rod shape-determining protein MreD
VSAAWFVAGLLGCVLSQAIFLAPISVVGIRPDFFLLLVLYLSQRVTPESATLLGFLVGLTQDALSGAPLGLRAFTDGLLGFLTACLSRDLYTETPLAQFGLVFAGSAGAGIVSLGLFLFFFGAASPVPPLLRTILPEAAYTAAAGVVLFSLPRIRAALARLV